ncbi:MAG: Dabb family protein [Pyrinomonadaceae bacterium]
MLTHLVMWRYRDDVPQETRQEHVAQLAALPLHIPEIESFNVGFDILRLERSYDTGLIAVFRDRAAREAYTVHSVHKNVVDFGRGISQHVASVDFESELGVSLC